MESSLNDFFPLRFGAISLTRSECCLSISARFHRFFPALRQSFLSHLSTCQICNITKSINSERKFATKLHVAQSIKLLSKSSKINERLIFILYIRGADVSMIKHFNDRCNNCTYTNF